MSRDIFNELKQGLEEYRAYEQGKITLIRSINLTKEENAPLDITPSELKSIREKLNLSQSVFAHRLRTSVRTYQGWEQGKTKPNPQAILLLRMVAREPGLFQSIAAC